MEINHDTGIYHSSSSRRQTRQTPELIGDVVRNNRFFPIGNEADRDGFKWQGVQYYRGFSESEGVNSSQSDI